MVMAKRDMGELLVQDRVITPEQLQQAREHQRTTGGDLATILVDLELASEREVLKAKATAMGIRFIADLAAFNVDQSAVNIVPAQVAIRHKVIPLTKTDQVLSVATANPTDVMALDELRVASGLKVQPVLALEDQIQEALGKYYAGSRNGGGAAVAPTAAGGGEVEGFTSRTFAEAIEKYGPGSGTPMDAEAAEAAAIADEAPIIRIANTIIQQAVKDQASDIHVEPDRLGVRIRFRIDGVLHEVMKLPIHIHPPLISRYKILAEMNIAERRIPQDGRIGIRDKNTGKDYDLRVSCLPTLIGEKIVMRILDKSSVMIGLGKLGFWPDTMAQVESVITQPNGMILSTGPTGAGKTTTQYSILNRINSVEKNIMTCEDPVEYQLAGISQVAVHRKAGLTFATALRSFMRQDPDIIMIGEIRDLETAEMAIQASLTGHLVLSTLHTNDAPSSVTRLVDMGVEPFLISATLIAAMAQRLARKICPNCAQEYEVDAADLRLFGFEPTEENQKVVLRRGRGCDQCRQTGYKGRIGIYEMMLTNEEIAELVVRRAPLSDVREAAMANGMKTLKQDGLRKVLEGVTTPDEVRRVVFTGGH
jgi:type IV pilus assembly protein PilB